ncbi:MarR family winged helix-turn-helix transcriptional regulator [Cellulomonas marina]|uniref:DNA-binding transcriptional regulator, MarR family n=1 Tax=Cellulomonas marina TaxID=988821 RepID=A0A1I0WNJ5_9CELL|nr:MarR family winged helix-turn-helix transcriptional regulator [Cellulomonas marina]GIG27777.1 hypothetical protein Cma02nite_03770 [Cellulomonas marina]SFA90355.1 DNA-binding transcriptional regulator, MarR family [Cellulomonas marina]
MATASACAALVDVMPDVLRLRRTLAAAPQVPGTAVLAAVLQLGHPRVSELADHLHLDLSTVSRKVAHLRDLHLVEAAPHPLDGRAQQLTVTPAGLDELRRVRRSLVDDLVRRLAGWDDADVATLTTLLGRLADDAAPPPARAACPAAPPPPAGTTRSPHLQETA